MVPLFASGCAYPVIVCWISIAPERYAAAASGAVRPDIDARELLYAVASLSVSAHGEGLDQSRRMVALLVDGLKYGAGSPKGGS